MTMNAEIKIRLKAKRCPCCGEMKAVSEFHLDKRRRDGRGTECKPCTHARVLRNYHKRIDSRRSKWAAVAAENAATA